MHLLHGRVALQPQNARWRHATRVTCIIILHNHSQIPFGHVLIAIVARKGPVFGQQCLLQSLRGDWVSEINVLLHWLLGRHLFFLGCLLLSQNFLWNLIQCYLMGRIGVRGKHISHILVGQHFYNRVIRDQGYNKGTRVF